jgi:endonuclease/exonuclease/phosphatase family metal-dependent hydrolase
MITFKVMTWNLENLYRSGNPYGPKKPEDYETKLSSLAAVILKLDPDVLAAQEVGQPDAFHDLADRLLGRYPVEMLSTHPDPRGIRVGFLSKLPVEEREDIVDFPQGGMTNIPGIDSKGNPTVVTRFGRGILRIRLSPAPGMPVHLIAAHLKSKLLSFPSPSGQPRFIPKNESERAQVAGLALLKRTAEAVGLRVIASRILEGNAQEALIVLGDLNDVPSAATTQILNGPGGSEIGSLGFIHPDKYDDTRLFNLAPRIPKIRRYSRVDQGNPELIDHIFVSQELLPGQPRRLPVVDSHVNEWGSLPSISVNPSARQGKPGSDHAPVTAVFKL